MCMTRSFLRALRPIAIAAGILLLDAPTLIAQQSCDRCDTIPLPEHPRPDFRRRDWQNLNGPWRFRADAGDVGAREGWQNSALVSPRRILVPFSWAAPLSGVGDTANVAWYERTITVPQLSLIHI